MLLKSEHHKKKKIRAYKMQRTKSKKRRIGQQKLGQKSSRTIPSEAPTSRVDATPGDQFHSRVAYNR